MYLDSIAFTYSSKCLGEKLCIKNECICFVIYADKKLGFLKEELKCDISIDMVKILLYEIICTEGCFDLVM